MSINLSQKKNDLLNAFNDVLDPNKDINWVVFAYDGNSNVLKVHESGDEGLEEMISSFNSSKIMYGITTVECPATKQPKVILIHWQGDSVPTLKLGTSASHIREVSTFFKGIHITVHARNEDDVEPDAIMSQVNKLTSTLSTSAQSTFYEPSKPVGSVYKRTLPQSDIDANKRGEFWDKIEREERDRQMTEQKRLSSQMQQMELEKKRLGDRLHCEQEKIIQNYKAQHAVMVPKQIGVQRTSAESGGHATKMRSMFEQKDATPPPVPQQVMQSTTISTAHRNGTTEPRSPEPQPTTYIPREPTPPHEPPHAPVSSPIYPPIPVSAEPTAPPPSAAVFSNVLPARQYDSEDEVNNDEEWEDDTVPEPMAPITLDQNRNSKSTEEQVYEVEKPKPTPGRGLQVMALWDYQAADDSEISFDPGDVICFVEQIDPGWWRGQNVDGTIGLFPANYVESLE